MNTKARNALLAASVVMSLSALPVAAHAATAANVKASVAKPVKLSRASRTVKAAPRARAEPQLPSIGQLTGLHGTGDMLDLKSAVALVVDQNTNEVLFSKNSGAVLPIASITKLMTALVVTEAGLALDEVLTVTPEDAAVKAGSRNQLRAGARLTRGEMMHLALMASENRAICSAAPIPVAWIVSSTP
jgi:D-alanyl-D-alanine endopeptidase (penicillin-binding protein 7)